MAARSSSRWRARSGTMWTNPSRSWFESRKPMPRPMPVSNRLAERDRLNVAMHWYWFQVLTMPLRVLVGAHHLEAAESSSSQRCPSPSNASSTAAVSATTSRGSPGPRLVSPPGGVNLASPCGRRRDDSSAPALELRGRASPRASRSGATRGRSIPWPRRRTAPRASCRPSCTPTKASRSVSKPVHVARAGEHRRVVATLAELGHVVDRGPPLHHHLADRERALVVGHVGERLVEGELDVGVQARPLALAGPVADGPFPDLDVLARRDEHELLDLEAALRARDARVAEPIRHS